MLSRLGGGAVALRVGGGGGGAVAGSVVGPGPGAEVAGGCEPVLGLGVGVRVALGLGVVGTWTSRTLKGWSGWVAWVPARLVARIEIRWSPTTGTDSVRWAEPLKLTSSRYGVHGEPSSWYSMDWTPLRVSEASRRSWPGIPSVMPAGAA